MIERDIVLRFALRLEVRGGRMILGDREAALLQGIERTRSMKEGAKLAGVSYRTAWAIARAMAQTTGRPVVRSRTGGPGGGASALTDHARELLRLYQDVHRQLDERLDQVLGTVARPR